MGSNRIQATLNCWICMDFPMLYALDSMTFWKFTNLSSLQLHPACAHATWWSAYSDCLVSEQLEGSK